MAAGGAGRKKREQREAGRKRGKAGNLLPLFFSLAFSPSPPLSSPLFPLLLLRPILFSLLLPSLFPFPCLSPLLSPMQRPRARKLLARLTGEQAINNGKWILLKGVRPKPSRPYLQRRVYEMSAEPSRLGSGGPVFFLKFGSLRRIRFGCFFQCPVRSEVRFSNFFQGSVWFFTEQKPNCIDCDDGFWRLRHF